MSWTPKVVDADHDRFVVLRDGQVGIAVLSEARLVVFPETVLPTAPLAHGTWLALDPADRAAFKAALDDLQLIDAVTGDPL